MKRFGSWRDAAIGGALLVAVAVIVSGPVQAAAPFTAVTGDYTYIVVEGNPGRAVTIDARGSDPVKGSWTWQALPHGPALTGIVTCLVLDGTEAYLFGPPTSGDPAAFFWLHDGGVGGKNDAAITFIQDPGQDIEELEGWCESSGASYSGLGPVGLTSGSLTIHNLR